MGLFVTNWDHMHGALLKKIPKHLFFIAQGLVDGHRHHMQALRAELTHVLASIALLSRLEQFVLNPEIGIPVYTDCKSLINWTMTTNINSPSFVMADHIDLTYQIRNLIENSALHINLEYTRTIKNDDFDMASKSEKLVQLMHLKACGYYTEKGAIIPRKYSDYLPGSKISIVANGKPLVSDIGMSIQSLERTTIRSEFLQNRLNMNASMIKNVDT